MIKTVLLDTTAIRHFAKKSDTPLLQLSKLLSTKDLFNNESICVSIYPTTFNLARLLNCSIKELLHEKQELD